MENSSVACLRTIFKTRLKNFSQNYSARDHYFCSLKVFADQGINQGLACVSVTLDKSLFSESDFPQTREEVSRQIENLSNGLDFAFKPLSIFCRLRKNESNGLRTGKSWLCRPCGDSCCGCLSSDLSNPIISPFWVRKKEAESEKVVD